MSLTDQRMAMEILEQALSLTGPERQSYLDEACADHPELRRQVEERLALQDETILAGPIVDRLPDSDTVLPKPGDTVGPYRIEKEIGRGGMGTVFLAHHPMRGRVALKCLSTGMINHQLLVRFKTEQRILANLNHPNIASLFDSGLTENQCPFYAMEYVEGEPIDTWCERKQLTLHQRLDLFDKVCDAVAYAHRNLIIHRDLKPANILVDENGEPRLLDFGIARLMDSDGETASTQTLMGFRMLTPEYAAPEQVRGQHATTACDVYALGMVLYELLTGQRPYLITDLEIESLFKVITQTRPPKPSAMVTRPGSSNFSLVRQGSTNRLRSQLSGDLDVIVLKSLRKEPVERYGTVEGLRDDISRHLKGLPIRARKPTLMYRTGKFLSRNRLAATFGAVFIVTCLVLLSMLLAKQSALQAALAKAEREAVTNRRVTTFVTDLFQMANPDQTLGEKVTVKDALHLGKEIVRHNLEGEPDISSRIMTVMGRAYLQLGLPAEAEPLIMDALEARRSLDARDEPMVESLALAARYYYTRGRYREADALYQEALALLVGPDDQSKRNIETVITIRDERAFNMLDQGKLREAKALAEENLQMSLEHLGEDDIRTSACRDTLGRTLRKTGDLEKAETHYRKSLQTRRKLLPPKHPLISSSMINLGMLLHRTRRFDEAARMYQEALALERETLGEDHPHTGYILSNLGMLYRARQDYSGALQHYHMALKVFREGYGEDDPHVINTYGNMGLAYWFQGRFEDAEQVLIKALTANRKLLGPHHPRISANLLNLAHVYESQGRYEEAEEMLHEALAIDLTLLGPDHRLIAQDLGRLGVALRRQGRHDEAEAILLTALTDNLTRYGEDSYPTGMVRAYLTDVLHETGRYAEAEVMGDKAFGAVCRNRPEAGGKTGMVAAIYGTALAGAGKSKEAEAMLLHGYQLARHGEGPTSPYTQLARKRIERFKKEADQNRGIN
ncbi:MAG: serine/threonine-protein kinase [Acidobacteriota bacterium]|nr:serine/threonine-protein kinase [Acidobacteriota bacterium]